MCFFGSNFGQVILYLIFTMHCEWERDAHKVWLYFLLEPQELSTTLYPTESSPYKIG